MPEGHALHRLARLHHRRFGDHEVQVTSPQGRFSAGARLVNGHRLRLADAYGKHLFHHYDTDLIVHVHLGLYGGFGEHQLPVTDPVGQVRMRIVGPSHYTDLRGPIACEIFTDAQLAALLTRLGPDPLRCDANPDEAWHKIARSRAPIATLVMDQKVLAGVGNAYRAEVLFRHGIHPLTAGRDLGRGHWELIWADLVALMRAGVRRGRIDTVRPAHMPAATGREPRRDRHGGEVYVYRRTGQPCLICATPVASHELAGRNLFWCPTCQPAGDHPASSVPGP